MAFLNYKKKYFRGGLINQALRPQTPGVASPPPAVAKQIPANPIKQLPTPPVKQLPAQSTPKQVNTWKSIIYFSYLCPAL